MEAESELGELTDVERDVVTVILRGHAYRESATRLGMGMDQLEAKRTGCGSVVLTRRFGVRDAEDKVAGER